LCAGRMDASGLALPACPALRAFSKVSSQGTSYAARSPTHPRTHDTRTHTHTHMANTHTHMANTQTHIHTTSALLRCIARARTHTHTHTTTHSWERGSDLAMLEV
jgi:hypothetical protein